MSDRTWATFVLALQANLPSAYWRPSSEITGPLRAVKDEEEIEAGGEGVAAACVGITCEEVDGVPRSVISDANTESHSSTGPVTASG